MIAAATVSTFALTTLALGLLLAFTPYLMRRNECFAVTVPPFAQDDPRLVALKKRYAVAMMVVTAASTAVAVAGGVFIAKASAGLDGATGLDSAAAVGTALELVAVLAPVVASFLLMLRNRRTVLAVKQAEGWAAHRSERAAVIGEEDFPGPISLAWNLLYIVVALATFALGLALYPSMPDVIPVHGDLAGNVDAWSEKSLGSVLGFPLLIQAFFGLVFFGCHAVMIRSKRPTDPSAPATSALAYGLFARAQSIFLLVVGIVLSAGIGVGYVLTAAGAISIGQMGIALLAVGLLVVAASIGISVVYGQNGARLFRRMQGDDLMPDDADEHWKLGVFYFNRDDASVFLPERFGIGWTINFARPAAWILIGCFLAADVLMVMAIAFLA